MPNPAYPQPYAVDPSMSVSLLSYDPSWFQLNGNVGATAYAAEFLWPSKPTAGGAARPSMLQYTASDFLDYYLADTGQGTGAYRSTQATPPSSSVYVPASANMLPGPMLCLFNQQGWGRDVDIALTYPAAATSVVNLSAAANTITLFGEYGGPIYIREAEYSQNYNSFYTSPGDPVFPFAPDALPLYTFPDAQAGANWPMNVDWPSVQVVTSQPGILRLKTTATDGQDDRFTHISYSGGSSTQTTYASQDRNIQIICLPLWIWAELPQIEGRSVTLSVAVNGATAEISVLRFSRLPYLPESRRAFSKTVAPMESTVG